MSSMHKDWYKTHAWKMLILNPVPTPDNLFLVSQI